MGKQLVEHTGRVVEVTPREVSVEILQESACAACHARSVCTASDQDIKLVTVEREFGVDYEVGETVRVVLSQTLGFRAVWISYVAPLIIVMILLLILPSVLKNDLYTGLACLASLAVYYSAVRIFRDRIRKEFIFTIEKVKRV